MFLILNLQDVDLTVRLCLLELILLSEITLLPRIPINIVLFVVKSLYKATQLWHWHITIHIHTDRQTDRRGKTIRRVRGREQYVC